MPQQNNSDLNPEVWGPHYWHFLHTVAFHYPYYPNSQTKRKFYDFVHSIPLFIPVKGMSEDFAQLLDEYPVTPYLDSRDSFVRWMHFIHNKINTKLEKPEISLHEFFRRYFHEYTSVKYRGIHMRQSYRVFMHIFVFILLIGIIVFLYLYYS